MSTNQGTFLKPPIIIAVVVVIALIGLSTGLRKATNSPDRREKAEKTDFEQLETGSTRISAVSAPSSRLSGEGQGTASRTPVKKSAPRKQLVEDYNTAKKRAEGNSAITGIVLGEVPEGQSSPEETSERSERFRRMFESRFGGERNANPPGRENNNQPRREFTTVGGDNSESTGSQDRRERFRDRNDRATSGPDPRMEIFARIARSNKPLEAAEVLLYEDDPNTTHPPLRTVLTDKEGSFTITGVNGADQRYMLVVKAEKFAPQAQFVTVTDVPREMFVRLEPGVQVKGKVLDKETSQPISGAVVYQPNSRFEASAALGVTTTSLNGEFIFPNTEPGRNLTMARADGYAITRTRINAPNDDSIIEMQPGGASISGVTVDRLTGKPQGGARVWAKGRWNFAESVLSAEDGTFTLANLPEGQFDVYAVRGMKTEEQEITLDRGESVKDIKLLMPSEVLVSGQVINANDRSPLAGIKVWFDSTKGAQYRKTNSDGRFSFETMAIEEYAILIHEKGYLPVKSSTTTDSQETIVRKIAKNQSSDELTIRLKPVPVLEGTVTGSGRGGRNQPINDADVRLAFERGNDTIDMKTKSDPAGHFFFNLYNSERGRGIVVATANSGIDMKDVRVPSENLVELQLERNMMSGQIMLIDESSLDGISVDVTRAIAENREDSRAAGRVKLNTFTSTRGGRLFGALPGGTEVELTFHLPDGASVTKDFQTNQLLNSNPIFVYDPVTQDIQADTTPSNRGGGRGGWGGGRGGWGGGRGGPGGGFGGGRGGSPSTASPSVQQPNQ